VSHSQPLQVFPLTSLDLSGLSAWLTQAGYRPEAIQAVMGGNMVRFLQRHLPNQ